MRKISRWLAAVLAVLMCLGLTACKQDFDAAGYTKAVLDANYQEEYADYAKFRDLSEEEAKKEIEDNRARLAGNELAGIGEVSDETKSAYIESLKTIEKLARYEVKKAKKQKDGSFIVEIGIKSSDIYLTLGQSSVEIQAGMPEEEKNNMSQDADAFARFMMQCIQKSVEGNTYGEETSVEVKITQDGEGAYGLESGAMNVLDNALFPQEEAAEEGGQAEESQEAEE